MKPQRSLCVRENQMEMKTNKRAQKMENLDATIHRLKGELGDTQPLLKEKTEALEHAEAMLQLQTSLLDLWFSCQKYKMSSENVET